MIELNEGRYGVEFGSPPKLDGIVPMTEERDRFCQCAAEVLERKRIGVA